MRRMSSALHRGPASSAEPCSGAFPGVLPEPPSLPVSEPLPDSAPDPDSTVLDSFEDEESDVPFAGAVRESLR